MARSPRDDNGLGWSMDVGHVKTPAAALRFSICQGLPAYERQRTDQRVYHRKPEVKRADMQESHRLLFVLSKSKLWFLTAEQRGQS
ncbi:MAG: hypothetical protein IPP40_18515 [bacterium]|nr:hypothetical protein [bacterium]